MSQASVPSPRTWSPGDQVLVPRLRADVTNAVAFLAGRPYFIGQCTTGPGITSGTAVPLSMDAELYDSWSGHLAPAGTATDGGYWCQAPGWYLCDTRVPWAYSGTTPAPFIAGYQGVSGGSAFGPSWGALAVNGSGNGATARSVDLILQTAAGLPGGSSDYIQPVTRQDSGGSVAYNTSAQNLPAAAIRWACATTGSTLPVPPLTAVPNPITSAWLNANVRDTTGFLTLPPAMRAHYTAGSSTLANSTLTTPQVVPLTTVDLDTYAGFTTGAAAKYTAPVAGRYLLAGQVNLASSSTATWYACGLLVNGSALYWGGVTRFAGSGLAGGAGVTRRLRLSQGDTVQLAAAQASGGAIAYNTTAANQTRLIALWEGL